MYQSITIAGNLGKDPELRQSNGGMAICTFSVAVGDRVKKDEKWEDETTWFNVVIFGKQAENAGKYLSKGSKVLVVGRIKIEKYADKKTGEEKTSVKLVANDVRYLSSKSDGPRSDGSRPKNSSASRAPDSITDGFIDDDLLF